MDILTLAQINKLKASGGIGYSEYETVELLSEQTAANEMIALAMPIEGNEITAYFNGVAYTQVAKSIELEGITFVYIGNGVEFGGEETEDDFCLAFGEIQGIVYAMSSPPSELADAESITISATGKAKVVHPINKAYIPFWDIKHYNTDGAISITANGETLDLDKAIEIAKSGIPSAITRMIDGEDSVDCYIPCGFLYDGGVAWMSCAPPTGKDIHRYQIKSNGIVST